jgi:RND family efflux transporter MFP subunit
MSDFTLPSVSTGKLKRAAFIGGGVLAVILIAGGTARVLSSRALSAETAAMSTPTVTVIQASTGGAAGVSLPGRLEAWSQAPVYARTNGYLRRWYADIGAHVRAGAVLADIDAPEVDQQLAAAGASLRLAQAELDLAQSTSERWRRLLEAGTVSQQAAEERLGEFEARKAARDQAQAEVRRLQALAGFKRVVAPFDGVITARTADVGALVGTGSGSTEPLFTLVDDRRLRLYVNVPENQASRFAPGSAAHFTVPDQPATEFNATVAASAGAVDPATGTTQIQLVVDNADGRLMPGGFARVALAPAAGGVSELSIPASALMFRREGPAVAVLGADNRVAIQPIAIARDDGRSLVIGSGLSGRERIIDNPTSAIASGQQVRIAAAAK